MLVAFTMNHGWLERLVVGHHPNMIMVDFYSNTRKGKQLIIHQGDHPVVVRLLPKDGALPTYVKEMQAMILTESGDFVVVVLADGDQQTFMQALNNAVRRRDSLSRSVCRD